MAQKWNFILRQVLLRGNLLQADSAVGLYTAYAVPGIGDTEIGDRAVEFPAAAVHDAILNAADRMVHMIGLNRYSRFRKYFAGTCALTAATVFGQTLPVATGGSDSPASKPIIGVIDSVFDSGSPKAPMQFMPKWRVIGKIQAKLTLKQTPKWYYTDNVRIWHTDATSALAGVVTWSKTDQLAAIVAQSDCPFPEELYEGLVTGALSYLFKENMNAGQVKLWQSKFNETLSMLALADKEMLLENRATE